MVAFDPCNDKRAHNGNSINTSLKTQGKARRLTRGVPSINGAKVNKWLIITLVALFFLTGASSQEAIISLGERMGVLYFHSAATIDADTSFPKTKIKKSQKKAGDDNLSPSTTTQTDSKKALGKANVEGGGEEATLAISKKNKRKSFVDKRGVKASTNEEVIVKISGKESEDTLNGKVSSKKSDEIAGEIHGLKTNGQEQVTDSHGLKTNGQGQVANDLGQEADGLRQGTNGLGQKANSLGQVANNQGQVANSYKQEVGSYGSEKTGRARVAVVIAPGGSYHHLGLFNEGTTSARWFCNRGVDAFVLRYRTAQNGFHNPAMKEDVFAAVKMARSLGFGKVGVVGYSAGGHLALMAGIFGEGEAKPDFVVSVYPVVSMMDENAHRWSRKSLLGAHPTESEKALYSMEKQVKAEMPPTYVVACVDDDVVKVENSLVFFDAAKGVGANVTLTIYPWGAHGFGMMEGKFMRAFSWNEALWAWMVNEGFVEE